MCQVLLWLLSPSGAVRWEMYVGFLGGVLLLFGTLILCIPKGGCMGVLWGVLVSTCPQLRLLSRSFWSSILPSSSFPPHSLLPNFSPPPPPPLHVSGCPLIPLPCSSPTSPPCLLSLLCFFAAILFHCLLLSSYSFSDSPGKTCWLSQPDTHTMDPSLLSRQQRTQPHQFHPLKRRKEATLKESRERKKDVFIWRMFIKHKSRGEVKAHELQEVCPEGN